MKNKTSEATNEASKPDGTPPKVVVQNTFTVCTEGNNPVLKEQGLFGLASDQMKKNTPTSDGFLHRVRTKQRPKYGEPLPENLADGRQFPVPHPEITCASVVTFMSCIDPDFNEMCSAEDKARLEAIAHKQEVIMGQFENFSLSNVSAHINAQRDAYHAALVEGKDVSKLVIETRDTVSDKFRVALSGLNNMLLNLTHQELVPTARPILEKFERAIEGFLRWQETLDREQANAYGLDFAPGPLWKAAAVLYLAYQPTTRIPAAHAWITPRRLLEGIVEI